MKNNYWMKLWFDILRDPKMGMLPDRLWRRVIELFLIAGQEGEDGALPEIATIAWQLNKPVSTIATDLNKIAETGIVREIEPGKWEVTNFKKRNEAVDPMKRMKDFRMRERYEKSNVDVTETLRSSYAPVTSRNQEAEEQINRETDKKIKPAAAAFSGKNSEIYKSYSSGIAELTPATQAAIDKAVDTYSVNWVRDAIAEGVRYQANSFGYCEKVLARWIRSGRNGNGARKPDTGADLDKFKKLYQSQEA